MAGSLREIAYQAGTGPSLEHFCQMNETLIPRPRADGDYVGRSDDCAAVMEIRVIDLVDFAQLRGWKARELFDGIEAAVKKQRVAYRRDPDPADEPI